MTDYYKVLGVERSASKEDIKKAYKKLAKQYHPDLNKEEGSDKKFKEINEAASILLDDQKKSQYDQFGSVGGNQGFDYSGFSGADFATNFEDIFDAFFGGSGGRRQASNKGQDLRYDIEITLEEAAKGLEKEITYDRESTCATCNGSGAKNEESVHTCATCGGRGTVSQMRRTPFGTMNTTATCPTCRGTGSTITEKCVTCKGSGVTVQQERVSIHIPAGIEDGTRLRVHDKGMAGKKGGPSGDLYVYVYVKPHKVFDRQGTDLHTTIQISIAQAALGDNVAVPTLEKEVDLSIPSGTQQGTKLRIKSKGLPTIRGSHTGDLYVHVFVQVPDKLSKKAKKLLEDLKTEVAVDKKKSWFK